MKKPLLVVLIVGLIPIIFLIVGLIISGQKSNQQTDNYLYPSTDNAFIEENQSRSKVEQFFEMAGKDLGVIYLFKDQTIDQLRYDNMYQTSLTVALENISSIKLNSIEAFAKDSWTAQDHLYLTSYDIVLTDNAFSFLGTNGTNEKLFSVTDIDGEWKISDIIDAPAY